MARLHSSECLSGSGAKFQKAIDIILKPVIGRFVSAYMDDVIITSPSFNEHLDHLNQDKSPTAASRHEGSGQYNKARETKTTKNGTNRAAERRTVQSKQTTTVRPCPYYLHCRVWQTTRGFPQERRNSGMKVFHRATSGDGASVWEALDRDPVDRSE
ncbi:uncharacterized protein TNCV_528621 [Trichonephila clavipes]|nr:uncharacterized protein TNCV_528621 [Trichonephila clavipes]